MFLTTAAIKASFRLFPEFCGNRTTPRFNCPFLEFAKQTPWRSRRLHHGSPVQILHKTGRSIYYQPVALPPGDRLKEREWIPENHIVHFIIDAVGQLNIRNFKVNKTGSGDEQYPPEMMPALLIYSYAAKRMSSRVIEDAAHIDIGAGYIYGTISTNTNATKNPASEALA
jgi:transposase